MRNVMSRILNVFKNKKKNGREFYFNDLYRVCKSASNELGTYCERKNSK